MRSQNIKHDPVRKVMGVSCLLLLLLTFLAVNPMGSSFVYAEEETAGSNDVAPLLETPSTVGISFSPASGSASLSPTTPTGQSAQINVLARVDVQNSGGYSVYLKGSSINLIGQKDSGNVIPGATTAKTYNEMDVNTWGYTANEGAVLLDNAAYKAVSVSGNGDKIAENTNTKIKADTKNIMLSFAAKINDEKPADTYQNTITMSVVSSPLQTTLIDLANMQDMTTAICDATPMYETKQLKDTRDGKYYWVTKLADNKCWMTQNLDLDIKTASGAINTSNTTPPEGVWPDASLSDYDVTPSTKVYATSTAANIDTISSGITSTYSWSLGDYRITNPNTSSDCGHPKNSAADCKDQFTAYTTPTTANKDENAHYILGNHYQWNTATAGTGGTITTGQAESSICPKGWRLPTSNTGGEFEALVTALGGTSPADNVAKAPFYGVMGGGVFQNVASLFRYVGTNGYYWSSTPHSNGTNAYFFEFAGTSVVFPSTNGARQIGRSVRCIAK